MLSSLFGQWTLSKLAHKSHSRKMSQQSRSASWCFTLNNYNDETQRLLRLCAESPDVTSLIFGREVSSTGTPHLQGFLRFINRKRFRLVQAFLPQGAHLEVARNPGQAYEYCKKDGDFEEFGTPLVDNSQGERTDLTAFKQAVCGGCIDIETLMEEHSSVMARYWSFCLSYVENHIPSPEIVAYPLRAWQQDLNSKLNLPPDERTIMVVVDREGNKGKTWFAHYYCSLHKDAQVLLPGKKADMAYSLRVNCRVYFIDAPRSKQGEYLQYDFLEELKNGYIARMKYQSRFVRQRSAHVVVLMNEEPDYTKLSADRFDVIHI